MRGDRYPCPQCAEMVMRDARICRFCRFDLAEAPPSPAADDAHAPIVLKPAVTLQPGARLVSPPPAPVVASAPGGRPLLIASGASVAILLLGLLVWLFLPPTTPQNLAPAVASAPERTPVATLPEAPQYPPLADGETLTWQAEMAQDVIERQVGPLAVRIGKVGEADGIAPRVEVGYAGGSVAMEGERVAPTYEHRVTALVNRIGAPPVVMLQSYSGGAHCCLRVQLAGLSGGALKVVDLGSWDGDAMAAPRDLSGDGIADFVFVDQAFLYAFAPYAMSRSVPKIVNVVGGRVVDVSTRPAFRRLFTEAMNENAGACRGDPDGMTRNGACAAYVAAAARVGQLGRAWPDMIAGYDATVDWVLPTGCAVAPRQGTCPAGQEVRYQSYPDALLAFLKREGYVARGWQPPGAIAPPIDGAEPAPDAEDAPST